MLKQPVSLVIACACAAVFCLSRVHVQAQPAPAAEADEPAASAVQSEPPAAMSGEPNAPAQQQAGPVIELPPEMMTAAPSGAPQDAWPHIRLGVQSEQTLSARPHAVAHVAVRDGHRRLRPVHPERGTAGQRQRVQHARERAPLGVVRRTPDHRRHPRVHGVRVGERGRLPELQRLGRGRAGVSCNGDLRATLSCCAQACCSCRWAS